MKLKFPKKTATMAPTDLNYINLKMSHGTQVYETRIP